MCSQDDLDLVRADGDGMYAREPHHPTMTDPPGPVRHKQRLSTVMCGVCAPLYVIHAPEWYPFVPREGEIVTCTTCGIPLAGEVDTARSLALKADASRRENEFLEGRARAQEHYTDVLAAARWKNTLEAIAKRAEAGLPMSTSALRDVINLANAALEIPPLGTRVRCLLPHRGEFGTIVAWDHDLGVPHARWDSDGTIEAVESHEYTTDLNEED